MSEPIQGQSHILSVNLLEIDETFSSSQTINYSVYRSSDNVLVDSGTMTELANVYVAIITLTDLGQHRVFYTPPSGFEVGGECLNVVSSDETEIENKLDTIIEKVCKILGLSQSNYRMTDQIYTTDGCLTSATVAIYNNSSDTDLEINPICRFQITAVYTNGLLTDYKVVEI